MRILLTVVVFIIFSLYSAIAAERTRIPLHETPRSLQKIDFRDEMGTPFTLDAWHGKYVLLNVWATWCGPCRTEMPTLDRLQSQLGSDRFEVVVLSIDRAGVGVVRKFFDEIGIKHLRIFIDRRGSVVQDLKVFGLPGTMLIGPSGQELGRLFGPAKWDAPEMINFLRDQITKTN